MNTNSPLNPDSPDAQNPVQTASAPPSTNKQTPAPKYRSAREASRIYLLPNLFTAGNMLCGFLSLHSCIKARFIAVPGSADANLLYQHAVYFILAACVCDLFDGRIARAAKRESLFGAEFDSIADTVSFGVAPAFMIYLLVLSPVKSQPTWITTLGLEIGWIVAFIYLLCVGIRLARFNVLTNPLVPGNEKKSPSSDFIGLPCPTAAGMVASIVLMLTTANLSAEKIQQISTFCLPLVLLVSFLMVSTIHYPSFKHINWNTRLKVQVFIAVFLFLLFSVLYLEYSIPLIFLAFILNGIVYSIKKKARERKAAADGLPVEIDFDDSDEDEDQ
jgi:CDP-diacylglycerol--serine O-phosphatidyltransferase